MSAERISYQKSEGKPLYTSFQSLVYDGQTAWKVARRHPLTVVSQAVEIPQQAAKWLLDAVIDNLPSYIPNSAKVNLRKSHPIPIIGFSAFRDPRIESTANTLESIAVLPSKLETETQQREWQLGIRLLDEFTINNITIDMIQNGSRNIFKKLLPKSLSDFYGEVTREMAKNQSVYKLITEIITSIYGPESSYRHETLKVALAIAAITGHHGTSQSYWKGDDVDAACLIHEGKNIKGLNDLALHLGKTVLTANEENTSSQTNPFKKYIKKLSEPSLTGTYSHEFPGVINLVGGSSIEYAYNTIPHEILHYLSTDVNRMGLLPVQYPKLK